MSQSPKPIVDMATFFVGGENSCNDPAFLTKSQYVHGINGSHRGGKFRTRPGLTQLIASPVGDGVQDDVLHPQGMCIFKPLNGTWFIVMAHGGKIYKSPYPFLSWTQIEGLQFFAYADQVLFEPRCIKSTITNADGSTTFVPQPYPVLMIQDGFTQAGYWDGSAAAHTTDVPIGQAHIWNSNRYWIASGHRLHAGDEGNPLQFVEETKVATGGFFVVKSEITALGETPDLQALLAWTHTNTTAFQSAILDRTQWRATQGFQKELFKNIGCCGAKAWVNQYGITWWMTSEKKVIELDMALQTYRTRRLKDSGYQMARSRAKMKGSLLRRVCAGQYENFLFFSVPAGDRHNAHTWVMDESVYDDIPTQYGTTTQASWAGVWKGIRPVEWVTETIDGQTRCIALSRDYAPSIGSDYRIGIWEAFCNRRSDVLLDGTVVPIKWSLESRQMAIGNDPKKITGVEAIVSELRNGVDIEGFYNGRRTGYKTMGGSRHFDASQVSPDLTVTDDFRPQHRTIRFPEIAEGSANAKSVQSDFIQSVDLAFGVYLEGTGEAAVDAIRIFCDPVPTKYLGEVKPDETTARLVSFDNVETDTGVAPVAVPAIPCKTGFIEPSTERIAEPFYSSRG